MNQNDAEINDVTTDHAFFPRFMIAARRVSTIRSSTDGQEGLAVFWSRAAAKRVARSKPGTVVVEATKEEAVAEWHATNPKESV